jgi:hypothetical protein
MDSKRAGIAKRIKRLEDWVAIADAQENTLEAIRLEEKIAKLKNQMLAANEKT